MLMGILIASISRCDQKKIYFAAFFTLITSNTFSFVIGSSPFQVYPESKNATLDDGSINMTCRAFAEAISFTVNKTNGNHVSIKDLGFSSSVVKVIEPGVLECTLTIKVSSSINNSKIVCQAYNITNKEPIDSLEAIIRIQGVLSKPTNVRTQYLINTSFVNITWDEPPTMKGTKISKYHVLVNDTIKLSPTTNEALLNISDFAPCDENRISVFAFNGLNGTVSDITPLYVPSVPAAGTQLNVTTDKPLEEDSGMVSFTLRTNASMLCKGRKPSGIRIAVSKETKDDVANKKYEYNLVEDDENKEFLKANETTVLKNLDHQINVSFYNVAGDFADMSFFKFSGNATKNSTRETPEKENVPSTGESPPTSANPTLPPSLGVQVVASYTIATICILLAASMTLQLWPLY